MWKLDIIQAVVGLSATGLISLIVLALSEIIGSDVQVMALQLEKNRRKLERQTEIDAPTIGIEDARAVAVEQSRDEKQRRLDAIMNAYRDNPAAQPADIYKPLEIPRSTFHSYVTQLESDGRLERNGTGVKVR
jgi:hypothetical protein